MHTIEKCNAKDPSKCRFHGDPAHMSAQGAEHRVMNAIVNGSFEDYEAARATQQDVKNRIAAEGWTNGKNSKAIGSRLHEITDPAVREHAVRIQRARRQSEATAEADQWLGARQRDGRSLAEVEEQISAIAEDDVRAAVQARVAKWQETGGWDKRFTNFEPRRRTGTKYGSSNSSLSSSSDMFDISNPIGLTNPASPLNPLNW